MKLSRLALVTLAASCCTAAFPQPTAQSTQLLQPSPGLDLLTRVAQKYVDAKSYDIEMVEETSSNSEYSHTFQKKVVIAAEAPGNRYYFEGRSSVGSAIKVADGNTVWSYHVNQHSYTQKPQLIDATEARQVIPISEMTLLDARGFRQRWGSLAKDLKAAELLPDDELTVNGGKVPCHIVRIRSSDEKRTRGNYSYDKKIWIDARREVVLKVEEHSRSSLASAPNLPLTNETIQTFSRAELDQPVQDSLFTFQPPADAVLVPQFADPMTDFMSASLIGHPVPPLKLKSADGKAVSIESFRGKPVLLDFWATWCAPCVASLPHLAKIDSEARDKGLVLIGVDQDEEAKTATDYLAKKGFSWPNYHDGDGAMEKLMNSVGVPRTVLVDARGKVVYDSMTATEDQLRTEIAKLGPEFASIAPKPPANPCLVANSDSPQRGIRSLQTLTKDNRNRMSHAHEHLRARILRLGID